MTIKLDQHTCPRCLGDIPNDLQRGEYPGALSRTDNETEVCSECGVLEGLEDWHGEGCMPKEKWAVCQ